MNRAADDSKTRGLPPWQPPADGFRRQLRPDRGERRRGPLTRRQVGAVRVTWVLVAAFCISVLSLDLRAGSFWRDEAVALPVVLVVSLVWFSPYQLGQLVGLRPPKDRA